MKQTTKTLCLLILALASATSLDAMAGFRNAATRAGGYFRRPQVPINTFAFGNKMPYNPTGAQQQTWWQRTKGALHGRDYPYAYPQYVRDVTATKNALRTNTAGLLTTLGLAGAAGYIGSEQYKQYQKEKAEREASMQKALLQKYGFTQE